MMMCEKCGGQFDPRQGWGDYAAWFLEETSTCGPCMARKAAEGETAEVAAEAAANAEAHRIAAIMQTLPPAVTWRKIREVDRGRWQTRYVVESVHEAVTVDGLTFVPERDDETGGPTGRWRLGNRPDDDGSPFVGERYYRSGKSR